MFWDNALTRADMLRLEHLEELEPEAVARQTWIDLSGVAEWCVREQKLLVFFGSGVVLSALFAVAAGWLVRFLTRPRPGHAPTLRRRLVRALADPALTAFALLCAFSFLQPVLGVLPRDWVPPLTRAVMTILTLIVAWGGIRLLTLGATALGRYAARTNGPMDDLVVDMVRKTGKIAISILTLLFIGQSIFQLNITALLAGAGVAGLAVAFAARDTLSNFFGTIVIIADEPFRVGDWIKVGDFDGVVESVGLRSTRIRTPDEGWCTIPNSLVASQTVENFSRAGYIRHIWVLTMTYAADRAALEQTMQLMHGIVDNFGGPDDPRYRPQIFFSQFADWSLNIKAIVWLKTGNFDQAHQLVTGLNLKILETLNGAKLQMAFPTTTNLLVGPLDVKSS